MTESDTGVSDLTQPIEHLDFDPACEYSAHGQVGPAELPAVWVLLQRPTGPCGCQNKEVLLLCEPCLQKRIGPQIVTCRQCMASWPREQDVIISFERIKK